MVRSSTRIVLMVSRDRLILFAVPRDGETTAYLEVLVDDCDGEQDARARADCTLPHHIDVLRC